MKKLLMSLLAAVGLGSVSFGADLITTEKWYVDTEYSTTKPLTIRRGENRNLEPVFRNYGRFVNLTTATNVLMMYKTSTMTNYYYATGMVYNATAGWCRIPWTPINECSNKTVNYDIYVYSATSTMVRGYGVLTFQTPSGYTGVATNPSAFNTLDWASIVNLHLGSAPFMSQGTASTSVFWYAGTGLTRNGQTGSLSTASIASLAKADTALQPVSTQSLVSVSQLSVATNSTLVDAKSYTDGATNDVLTTAKNYTDVSTQGLVTVSVTNGILASAISYTDVATQELVKASITNGILSEAIAYTDGATNQNEIVRTVKANNFDIRPTVNNTNVMLVGEVSPAAFSNISGTAYENLSLSNALASKQDVVAGIIATNGANISVFINNAGYLTSIDTNGIISGLAQSNWVVNSFWSSTVSFYPSNNPAGYVDITVTNGILASAISYTDGATNDVLTTAKNYTDVSTQGLVTASVTNTLAGIVNNNFTTFQDHTTNIVEVHGLVIANVASQSYVTNAITNTSLITIWTSNEVVEIKNHTNDYYAAYTNSLTNSILVLAIDNYLNGRTSLWDQASAHTNRTDNPHAVTAAQAGALSVNGGFGYTGGNYYSALGSLWRWIAGDTSTLSYYTELNQYGFNVGQSVDGSTLDHVHMDSTGVTAPSFFGTATNASRFNGLLSSVFVTNNSTATLTLTNAPSVHTTNYVQTGTGSIVATVGAIRIGESTSTNQGIWFGNDTYLYRSSEGVLVSKGFLVPDSIICGIYYGSTIAADYIYQMQSSSDTRRYLWRGAGSTNWMTLTNNAGTGQLEVGNINCTNSLVVKSITGNGAGLTNLGNSVSYLNDNFATNQFSTAANLYGTINQNPVWTNTFNVTNSGIAIGCKRIKVSGSIYTTVGPQTNIFGMSWKTNSSGQAAIGAFTTRSFCSTTPCTFYCEIPVNENGKYYYYCSTNSTVTYAITGAEF